MHNCGTEGSYRIKHSGVGFSQIFEPVSVRRCPLLAAARRHRAAFSGHLSLGHHDFPRNHAALSTRASKISVVRGRGSLQMLRAPVFLGGVGCGTMENTSNWRHGIYGFWNGWTCESLLVGKCPHPWSLNLSRPDNPQRRNSCIATIPGCGRQGGTALPLRPTELKRTSRPQDQKDSLTLAPAATPLAP